MDLSIDLNLVLSIWTGSIVPIFLTYLGYRLTRGWEIKRRTFEDKKRVYTRFEVAIGKLAQALTDYRTLQLMEPKKDGDLKDMQFLYMKLTGLQSIWLDEGSVDVLRDITESENSGKSKPSQAEMRAAFEEIKGRLSLEMGHYIMVRSDIMGKYHQEIQSFKLSQSIRDSLGRVFQLIAQMGQAMAGSSLLSVMEYSAFDKVEDVGSWITQITEALGNLRKALNDDLQLSS